MWYFIVFLLTGPVQMGPFTSAEHCDTARRAVLTYPHRTADGFVYLGCWVVAP